MRQIMFLCIVFSLVALSACTSEDAPVAGAGDSAATAPVPAADPLTGTWVGDWGPTQERRNPVTVAINWDGANLSGTVNHGPEAVTITKGSFAADTGMVTMEASANATGGKMIHYTVEGKLAEGAITGTWMEDDKKGDFKITKR
jgi:uncharacterized protein (DUF2147 family)